MIKLWQQVFVAQNLDWHTIKEHSLDGYEENDSIVGFISMIYELLEYGGVISVLFLL